MFLSIFLCAVLTVKRVNIQSDHRDPVLILLIYLVHEREFLLARSAPCSEQYYHQRILALKESIHAYGLSVCSCNLKVRRSISYRNGAVDSGHCLLDLIFVHLEQDETAGHDQ